MTLALAVLGLLAAQDPKDPKGIEFFEKKIRPVLVEHCYSCHSAQAEKVKGALLLDTRQGLLKGGNMGAAVVPGNVDQSVLIQAIRYHDEDLRMPPKKRLSEEVVADFEAWIRMGVPDPRDGKPKAAGPVPIAAEKLWSFRPVVDPAPPAVRDAAWTRNAVDRFILARLEGSGLRPAPEADKQTLLRRATFDLTGLPPTPEELEAFLADESPEAFAKAVERLLASPRYGERWGRHWLDVARYADTGGDASDWPVPEVRLYRDYVIDAFNRDMPYDQFVVEQLAGDRLALREPDGDRFEEKIVATGFVALTRRFNNSKYGDMHLVMESTIDTVGKAFLGMSIACARCHDHKFDPISREDYYGLYGYFASTQYPHNGTEHGRGHDNLVPLTRDPELFEKARAWMNRWHEAYHGWRKDNKGGAKEKFEEVKKERPDVRWAWAVVDRKETGDEPIHLVGDPNRKGEKAPRGFLRGITRELPAIPSGQSGRLELARWLASKENPLTARVMVNRIWQQHFGVGIVPTSSMFGSQGQVPTHPELLDWLASRFVEGGWSVKAVHRLLMNSASYRQSSDAPAETLARDPGNDLLSRFRRRRLEGEAIRDAILFASGRLDLARPGTHPFPAEDEMNYTQHRPFATDYDHEHRSVYLMVRRLGKHPFMALFDGPDSNVSTGERNVSTVALQALYLMNSPLLRTASESFAERIRRGARDDAARIALAHRLAFGRDPDSREERDGGAYLREYREGLEAAGVPGDRELLAWSSLCRILLSSSEFFYVE